MITSTLNNNEHSKEMDWIWFCVWMHIECIFLCNHLKQFQFQQLVWKTSQVTGISAVAYNSRIIKKSFSMSGNGHIISGNLTCLFVLVLAAGV